MTNSKDKENNEVIDASAIMLFPGDKRNIDDFDAELELEDEKRSKIEFVSPARS